MKPVSLGADLAARPDKGSASLYMGCACGRSVSVACPKLSDLPAALDQLLSLGWGYDAKGRAKCADCLAALSVEGQL